MAIGGTIGDLQKRMGVREMQVWQAYFTKHGRITPERSFDRGPAIVASFISRANGGKVKPEDLMPYPIRPDTSNEPPPLDALVGKLGAKRHGSR